ncbi:hypothetical protein M8C21_006446, partial [Ambrosia artemisiifolia]
TIAVSPVPSIPLVTSSAVEEAANPAEREGIGGDGGGSSGGAAFVTSHSYGGIRVMGLKELLEAGNRERVVVGGGAWWWWG